MKIFYDITKKKTRLTSYKGDIEGAPLAGNPTVCPADTPRAGQLITKGIPNKLPGPTVDPAGSACCGGTIIVVTPP